ncbi:MAG: glycosyltransferase, partial [Planctomycetota bacterium]|nr:glycosyltransferase [Planctomycetota bacterium]
ELIGRTIDSIHVAAKLSDHPYEIIVANDSSEDRTAEIAERLGAIVVQCNNRQIGVTRNDGANASKGERLVFVDADTIVSPAIVQETIEAFDSGAVSGTSFPRFDEDVPLMGRILTPTLRISFRILRLAAGAYMFCTREAFDAVGGFDKKFFAGEEVHLSMSLHKHGSFKTLKSQVVTSGRKFQTFSSFEMLLTMILVSIPGVRRIRKRPKLWYGERNLTK